MAKRQGFVIGSTNPVTETKSAAQLNTAWNQLEVLKAGDLDGVFKSTSSYGKDSSNEIANTILRLTGAEPTGATETELADALEAALEEIKTTSLTFKGYVATSAPSSSEYSLREGNIWINSATMPTTFPVPASDIKVWNGTSWVNATAGYTAVDFDFFRNINDHEGYYWFGGQWKTMSTDMSTTYFSLDATGKWIINPTYDASLAHLAGAETISGDKTFTGTVALGTNTTGVTQEAGDNTTKLATTAFVANAISGGASDETVVHKAGVETITGVKTFSALPVITATEAASSSTTDTAIPTKGWVNDSSKATNVVHRNGTETIAGTKSFTGTVTATTQASSDNSTKVATTAFVQTAMASASVAIDGTSITKNTSNALQASGVIDNRDGTTPMKIWAGTLLQYQAIPTKDINTYYNITDDVYGGDSVYTKAEVNALVGVKSPVGSITAFGGSTAPDGWLICNGGEISRTTYADLFSVIETTYGSGDGSTTFNLPDLDNGDAPLGAVSSYIGQSTNGQIPNITGTIQAKRIEGYASIYSESSGAFSISGSAGETEWPGLQAANGTWNRDIFNFNASSCSSVYTNGETKVRAAGVYVSYIIKY